LAENCAEKMAKCAEKTHSTTVAWMPGRYEKKNPIIIYIILLIKEGVVGGT